jgi:hypothetical protein
MFQKFCLFDGVQRHFQQYFSYIVVICFIGGGSRKINKVALWPWSHGSWI